MRLKSLIKKTFLLSLLLTPAAYAEQDIQLVPIDKSVVKDEDKGNGRVLVSIHEVDPADEPIEHKAYLKSGALSFEEYRDISQEEPWCTVLLLLLLL